MPWPPISRVLRRRPVRARATVERAAEEAADQIVIAVAAEEDGPPAALIDQLIVTAAAIQRRVRHHTSLDHDAIVSGARVVGNDAGDVVVNLAIAERADLDLFAPRVATEVRDPISLRAVRGIGPAGSCIYSHVQPERAILLNRRQHGHDHGGEVPENEGFRPVHRTAGMDKADIHCRRFGRRLQCSQIVTGDIEAAEKPAKWTPNKPPLAEKSSPC